MLFATLRIFVLTSYSAQLMNSDSEEYGHVSGDDGRLYYITLPEEYGHV